MDWEVEREHYMTAENNSDIQRGCKVNVSYLIFQMGKGAIKNGAREDRESVADI